MAPPRPCSLQNWCLTVGGATKGIGKTGENVVAELVVALVVVAVAVAVAAPPPQKKLKKHF